MYEKKPLECKGSFVFLHSGILSSTNLVKRCPQLMRLAIMPITSMFAALFSSISIANSCLSLTFASDILCIYERKPDHYPLLGNQLCPSVYSKPSFDGFLTFFVLLQLYLHFI